MKIRWPWSRQTPPQTGHPTAEATSAAAEAHRALRDMQNLAGRVEDVTDRLSKTREKNHFAAAIQRAIGGA